MNLTNILRSGKSILLHKIHFLEIEKGSKVYTFKNDLSFKEYLNKLEEVGFKVQNLYIWMKRWNKNDYCKEKRNYPTAKPVNIMDLISY
uniref:Uncharacterized protein n=1 Tax=Geoglobus ahangari TaxID=113653 RepID=A0A7J3TI47_9EURY